jgi:ABC-type multidrug transport system fused ATPase/permease subunit
LRVILLKSYKRYIFYKETKIDATSDEGDKPKSLIGDIEFDNVIFTYPARQEAPVCLSHFF